MDTGSDKNASGPIDVDVSEQSQSSDSKEASILEKQTRTRRLFSSSQLFFFSICYMGTWSAVGGNMYYAIINGGPTGWFFSYIVVFFGVMCQVASFGELAAIQPIAGAQYHWTFHYAPVSNRRFLTWLQGWATWIGYIATLASCFNYSTALIEGLVQLRNPGYQLIGWHTTLIVLGTLAPLTLVNMYAFRLVPLFELLSGILNVCLFVVFIIVLFAMSPRNAGGIFLEANISSGWDSYFSAVNIGALSNIFLFIGFESVIHMGEETRDPKRAVPRALFWSIFSGGVMAFVTLITLLICMPSVDVILSYYSPVVGIIYECTGRSLLGTTALMSGIIIMTMAANVAVISSVSRLTWSWARDGGLPRYFGYVDGKHRIPLRAVLLTFFLVSVLSLLNLGTETHVALGAMVSLSSLAMYTSYAIVFGCVLYARWTTKLQLGEWNWGRAGPVLNIIALVYTIWAGVWLSFPTYLPVTSMNMNYCAPAFAAVVLGAVILWYARARKHWAGPNRAIANLILRE
ncbi:Choline transport protein [Cytospora mali]|uniref:Choline transport protein n=1 Tax=Cytospora mali TaxID=578113 RepID=A0A194VEP8_CYTMA|nr:Choline transport protein [Valsa mali var. pyri (nom. inval.)]